jgi:hypothetical protein
MAILVKHNKVSTVPDTTDTSLVRPSDWNADHTLTGFGTAAEKDAGVPNGVATLDSGGKVPVSELPAAVLGALSYQGTWNASTNTPTLTSSTGTKGYYYVVSVAGNTNLDGITDWLIGDWAVYNGTVWQKVDNTETVTSVNGQTGSVVLTTTNIAEGTNEYFTTARARASVSAGTGISYDSGTGVITNSSPSLGGDVVGPASATDNALVRYDSTTGKLIQNSVVLVGDTGSITGVNALTAESLVINNNATLGSSNTDTLDVNARITTDLEPNANNAKDIGTSGRNWRDGFFGRTLSTVNIEVTGTTSFDGSQGTSGQVLTSAGTGNTPTWTTPTTGTVTSVGGTGTVNGITLSGTVTSSGNLTLGGTLSGVNLGTQVTGTLPIANGGTGETTRQAAMDALAGAVTSGQYLRGNGTDVVMSAIQAADVPTLNQNTTGTASNVTGTVAIANGGTGQTTRQNAMDALAGAVTSGQYLRGNGTDVVMSAIQAADVPTLNQNTTGSAATLTTGRTIGMTGDVTWTSGSFNGSANVTGTATLATVSIAKGGTGQTTATAAFNALNPMTTTGDIIYEASSTVAARLGIGSTGQVLTVSGGLPAWANSVSSNITALGMYENSATISANYTIGSGNNAMSAGPITINSGVTVTVPTGSTWTVV